MYHGKNTERAKYETAANKAIKAAQIKHIEQINDRNDTIKELTDDLQKQLSVVRNSKDECIVII